MPGWVPESTNSDVCLLSPALCQTAPDVPPPPIAKPMGPHDVSVLIEVTHFDGGLPVTNRTIEAALFDTSTTVAAAEWQPVTLQADNDVRVDNEVEAAADGSKSADKSMAYRPTDDGSKSADKSFAEDDDEWLRDEEDEAMTAAPVSRNEAAANPSPPAGSVSQADASQRSVNPSPPAGSGVMADGSQRFVVVNLQPGQRCGAL